MKIKTATDKGMRAYLGLGTNVGERRGNLRRAVTQLRRTRGVKIRRVSPIYETEPQIVADQPWFLNQVVEVETGLTPARLHAACRKIEKMMGRRRGRRFGPRVMDIDILLYGGRGQAPPVRGYTTKTKTLTIPHPRMQGRRFVLKPLADLAPSLVHPVLGKTIRALLRRCPARGQTVRRNLSVKL